MHSVSNDKRLTNKVIFFWTKYCTSEIGAVWERGSYFPVLGDDVHDTLLYEVHLGAHGPLPDDEVPGLEHLKPQLADHLRHELGVRVGKERNGLH